MKKAILYIHGKGGSASESEHYKPLFPDCDVIGLDYKTFTPWETGKEIHAAVEKLKAEYDSVIITANSIGAFFSMNAELDRLIEKAFLNIILKTKVTTVAAVSAINRLSRQSNPSEL